MILTRKLGAVLRGKATPFQIVAACVFGALLGFAPGLLDAPALYALLVAGLLLVNANLGLALLVLAGTRLLSLLVVSLSFQVGRFLLDGPTEGIAQSIVNAPVLAWCGLERYAVAGGQLVGLVVGLAIGLALSRTVNAFRRKMIAAAENPKRWQELAQKKSARVVLWLFFGGTGKKSWDEKLSKRVGNPVRIAGAVVIVLGLVGIFFAQETLAGPLARNGLRTGLEDVNGATVDVGGVELALGEGRIAVSELALADLNALDTDLFRAGRLEADVDQADLLRRRVHVARVVVSDAKSGSARTTPGVRVGEPEPEDSTEGGAGEGTADGELTLEDVVAEYEVWSDRLAQVQQWLERLSGPQEEGEDEEDAETLAERLAREVRERGWFGVQAEHLVEDAPTFRLTELVVDGLEASWLPGHVFDLRGEELSTHPGLVDAPPRLRLASRDGAMLFEVDLAPASRGGGDGGIRFHWKGLSVDETLGRLRLPGGAPLSGGTLDLELDGTWAGGRIGEIALPLAATFHNTTIKVGGAEETLPELNLPIELRGALDAPRIRFDANAFADALADAGRRELSNRLRNELGGEVDEALDELRTRTGIELPDELPADLETGKKKLLESVFGGKQDDD